jgi:integrase
VLSQQEVARLIDAAEFPFHRILLMTRYATGARRAEVARLKISDIDSPRMVIHIRGGKGRKDRDVMLRPKLLDALRGYWRGLLRKPTDWLFPGNRWHTASHPVSTKVLWSACQLAAEPAGLEHKHIHPHTLRHCFATSDTALRLQARKGSRCRILSLIAPHEGAGRSQVDFPKLPTITRLISSRLNYRLASHSPFWHCNQ